MSKKLTSSCNDALQVNQNQIILYKQNNTYSSENINDSILSEPFAKPLLCSFPFAHYLVAPNNFNCNFALTSKLDVQITIKIAWF